MKTWHTHVSSALLGLPTDWYYDVAISALHDVVTFVDRKINIVTEREREVRKVTEKESENDSSHKHKLNCTKYAREENRAQSFKSVFVFFYTCHFTELQLRLVDECVSMWHRQHISHGLHLVTVWNWLPSSSSASSSLPFTHSFYYKYKYFPFH